MIQYLIHMYIDLHKVASGPSKRSYSRLNHFPKRMFFVRFVQITKILSTYVFSKVEKILKGSLDSIPSPSPSVKIQIMGGKVCF